MKKLREFFRNGLAIEAREPNKLEKAFIEKLSDKARAYHLSIPVLIFLEGFRPLTTVAASVLTGLEPAAEIFFPVEDYRRLISFVENRKNLDRLIAALSSHQ